jgi:hypothetical protein
MKTNPPTSLAVLISLIIVALAMLSLFVELPYVGVN